jgi:hypothetical protein
MFDFFMKKDDEVSIKMEKEKCIAIADAKLQKLKPQPTNAVLEQPIKEPAPELTKEPIKEPGEPVGDPPQKGGKRRRRQKRC